MGIYRQKNCKVWYMRFTHGGKQKRVSTKTTNKKQALRFYHKVMGDIAEGRWFDKPEGENKTLNDLLEKYLREHSKRNKAEKSYIRDQSLGSHLKRLIGEGRIVTEISPKLVSRYKNRRRDEGAAPNTVNNELRLLSHAFNLAIREWEWLETNPVARVTMERVNNQVERWLTHDEQERLLAVSPTWLREIIIFAINTGLRQSEIVNLKWERVDLFRSTLTILEQKNGGKDTLPLNAQALGVLKARHKVRSINTNLVFYSKQGTQIDQPNLVRAFSTTRAKVGLQDVRFHDLRHTFATRMVQAGVDLYKVQKLMRHKTPLMTQRYAHHYSESLRDGVEILDQLA